MHTNENNPLNLRRIFPKLETVIDMNRTHQAMKERIAQAHPDSLALQQVQAAQYAEAVSALQFAIDRVSGLQLRISELAYANAPNPELDHELSRMGL
jgi:hypothetical protein